MYARPAFVKVAPLTPTDVVSSGIGILCDDTSSVVPPTIPLRFIAITALLGKSPYGKVVAEESKTLI